MRKTFLLAALAGSFACATHTASAADYGTGAMGYGGPKVVLFAGADARERSFYGYGGFVWAPVADLTQSTWLLRGIIGGGTYKYNNAGVVGGVVDGDQVEGDLMVGYQWQLQPGRFSLYGGLNVQDHDHTPVDPTNSTAGTEAGFKVQAELESSYDSQFYYGFAGSFSTANDTYWARARVGWKVLQFTVGPEVVLSGNNEYDAQRVGAFASYSMDNFSISGSLGWADVSGTQASDGIYGSISVGYAY